MKRCIRRILTKTTETFVIAARYTCGRLHNILTAEVYVGRNIAHVPLGALVFFPLRDNTFCCGIAAIVSYKSKKSTPPVLDTAALEDMISQIVQSGYESCNKANDTDIDGHYLGGKSHLDSLSQAIQNLKCADRFYAIFINSTDRRQLADLFDLSLRGTK